jgi:four helix bundle protein
MTESQNSKYDLEGRSLRFAQDIREYLKTTKIHPLQFDDAKQLIRSSGSIAANYIEANEGLSKKDFVMRIKICRKESKETILWLRLLDASPSFVQEATELMKIFGAILEKSK